MMQLWIDIGFKPQELNKCPKVLIDEVFESAEMRATMYRQCVEWGANLHSGDGMGFVMAVIWLCGNHYMSIGGTHTLAHAMAECGARGRRGPALQQPGRRDSELGRTRHRGAGSRTAALSRRANWSPPMRIRKPPSSI